ncbi:hypothetical protein AQUSIP_04870 [Aquicella siphonis]|uniref:Uncharacterized protein n=1 Tax=Aquicella siphonis TaxID=254247 RepID=A0A5E4PE22_9COXI|nr:hypothetical protein [Aquicella siphonis]VVC75200.1 hypothetical protein AQUSIP_04870 [Aquicella siphonis]
MGKKLKNKMGKVEEKLSKFEKAIKKAATSQALPNITKKSSLDDIYAVVGTESANATIKTAIEEYRKIQASVGSVKVDVDDNEPDEQKLDGAIELIKSAQAKLAPPKKEKQKKEKKDKAAQPVTLSANEVEQIKLIVSNHKREVETLRALLASAQEENPSPDEHLQAAFRRAEEALRKFDRLLSQPPETPGLTASFSTELQYEKEILILQSELALAKLGAALAKLGAALAKTDVLADNQTIQRIKQQIIRDQQSLERYKQAARDSGTEDRGHLKYLAANVGKILETISEQIKLAAQQSAPSRTTAELQDLGISSAPTERRPPPTQQDELEQIPRKTTDKSYGEPRVLRKDPKIIILERLSKDASEKDNVTAMSVTLRNYEEVFTGHTLLKPLQALQSAVDQHWTETNIHSSILEAYSQFVKAFEQWNADQHLDIQFPKQLVAAPSEEASFTAPREGVTGSSLASTEGAITAESLQERMQALNEKSLLIARAQQQASSEIERNMQLIAESLRTLPDSGEATSAAILPLVEMRERLNRQTASMLEEVQALALEAKSLMMPSETASTSAPVIDQERLEALERRTLELSQQASKLLISMQRDNDQIPNILENIQRNVAQQVIAQQLSSTPDLEQAFLTLKPLAEVLHNIDAPKNTDLTIYREAVDQLNQKIDSQSPLKPSLNALAEALNQEHPDLTEVRIQFNSFYQRLPVELKSEDKLKPLALTAVVKQAPEVIPKYADFVYPYEDTSHGELRLTGPQQELMDELSKAAQLPVWDDSIFSTLKNFKDTFPETHPLHDALASLAKATDISDDEYSSKTASQAYTEFLSALPPSLGKQFPQNPGNKLGVRPVTTVSAPIEELIDANDTSEANIEKAAKLVGKEKRKFESIINQYDAGPGMSLFAEDPAEIAQLRKAVKALENLPLEFATNRDNAVELKNHFEQANSILQSARQAAARYKEAQKARTVRVEVPDVLMRARLPRFEQAEVEAIKEIRKEIQKFMDDTQNIGLDLQLGLLSSGLPSTGATAKALQTLSAEVGKTSPDFNRETVIRLCQEFDATLPSDLRIPPLLTPEQSRALGLLKQSIEKNLFPADQKDRNKTAASGMVASCMGTFDKSHPVHSMLASLSDELEKDKPSYSRAVSLYKQLDDILPEPLKSTVIPHVEIPRPQTTGALGEQHAHELPDLRAVATLELIDNLNQALREDEPDWDSISHIAKELYGREDTPDYIYYGIRNSGLREYNPGTEYEGDPQPLRDALARPPQVKTTDTLLGELKNELAKPAPDSQIIKPLIEELLHHGRRDFQNPQVRADIAKLNPGLAQYNQQTHGHGAVLAYDAAIAAARHQLGVPVPQPQPLTAQQIAQQIANLGQPHVGNLILAQQAINAGPGMVVAFNQALTAAGIQGVLPPGGFTANDIVNIIRPALTQRQQQLAQPPLPLTAQQIAQQIANLGQPHVGNLILAQQAINAGPGMVVAFNQALTAAGIQGVLPPGGFTANDIVNIIRPALTQRQQQLAQPPLPLTAQQIAQQIANLGQPHVGNLILAQQAINAGPGMVVAFNQALTAAGIQGILPPGGFTANDIVNIIRPALTQRQQQLAQPPLPLTAQQIAQQIANLGQPHVGNLILAQQAINAGPGMVVAFNQALTAAGIQGILPPGGFTANDIVNIIRPALTQRQQQLAQPPLPLTAQQIAQQIANLGQPHVGNLILAQQAINAGPGMVVAFNQALTAAGIQGVLPPGGFTANDIVNIIRPALTQRQQQLAQPPLPLTAQQIAQQIANLGQPHVGNLILAQQAINAGPGMVVAFNQALTAAGIQGVLPPGGFTANDIVNIIRPALTQRQQQLAQPPQPLIPLIPPLTPGQHQQLDALQQALAAHNPPGAQNYQAIHDIVKDISLPTSHPLKGRIESLKNKAHALNTYMDANGGALPPQPPQGQVDPAYNNLIALDRVVTDLKAQGQPLSLLQQYYLTPNQQQALRNLHTALVTHSQAPQFPLAPAIQQHLTSLRQGGAHALPTGHKLLDGLDQLHNALAQPAGNPQQQAAINLAITEAMRHTAGHLPPQNPPVPLGAARLSTDQRQYLRDLQRLIVDDLGLEPGQAVPVPAPHISDETIDKAIESLAILTDPGAGGLDPTHPQRADLDRLYQHLQGLKANPRPPGWEITAAGEFKRVNDAIAPILPPLPAQRQLTHDQQDDLHILIGGLETALDNVSFNWIYRKSFQENMRLLASGLVDILKSAPDGLREGHALREPLMELLEKMYPAEPRPLDLNTLPLNPLPANPAFPAQDRTNTELETAFKAAKTAFAEQRQDAENLLSNGQILMDYQKLSSRYQAEMERRSGSISPTDELRRNQIARKCNKMIDSIDIALAKLREKFAAATSPDEKRKIDERMKRLEECREKLNEAVWNQPQGRVELVNCLADEHVVLRNPSEDEIMAQVHAYLGLGTNAQAGGLLGGMMTTETALGMKKSERFDGPDVRVQTTAIATKDAQDQPVTKQFVTVQGTKNNAYQSRFYYTQSDITKMSDEQLIMLAAKEAENFNFGNPNKNLPITLKGNMHPRLAEAICVYCELRGYTVPRIGSGVELPPRNASQKADFRTKVQKTIKEKGQEIYGEKAKELGRDQAKIQKREIRAKTSEAEVPLHNTRRPG